MGAFLDKPKTEKTNHVGVGRDFKYAVASMQGWRVEMEDAHDVAIELQNSPPFDNWSFFAVFDGHAGNRVAQHSAENLLQTLLRTEEFKQLAEELKSNDYKMTDTAKTLIREGMRTGFLQLDEAMQSFHGDERERSGTTAICAIMTPEHIFVANLGDSRGVLSRVDDQTFSTEDHKPYLEKERERILRAGGSVMIQRVNGSLAVSRALGDYEYKSVPGLCPTEQLVSPEPDIYILDRNKENDEFLVLACDGIYDVLSNEELCRLVRSRLQATDDLKQATNQVLDVCLSLGSRDNMTMILVVLDAAPKTDPAKVESEREWLQRADHMLDEILKGIDVENVDADLVMTLLKQEGCEELPIPGGIHLARSIIDNKLQKLLESHSPPSAQEQNYGEPDDSSPDE